MQALTILRAIAAAAVAAAMTPVSAQSLQGDVSVKVSLASKCRVKAGATPVVDFGTYTAFGAAKSLPGAASVTFECTRGFGGTPTATWDTTNGTVDGSGVLAGLQYTLTVSGGTRTGGAAATAATLGGADEMKYSVDAAMPANQAGAGATATVADSHTRTLLVSF
jgi:spore coat protein U-like protein